MSALYEISGRCHCGNIEYEFTSPLQKTELPIRTCDCSFCTKQGACYTSHPQGKLVARIKDRTLLQTYRFGSEAADAYICRQCGVYPFIASELDGTLYAVLNANSINGLHIAGPSSLRHNNCQIRLKKSERPVGSEPGLGMWRSCSASRQNTGFKN
ncbi:MAG: hypothetical protein C0619_10150 [Desulfuromonas sp.]|nr:MAG: hypothetical protein C0619_10150 [Desulfuromonas sp.]